MKPISSQERAQAYRDYEKETNMSFNELLKWSKNPISKKASLDPKEESEQAKRERDRLLRYIPTSQRAMYNNFYTANIRNLVLKKTALNDWDRFLVLQSKKAVKYLKRAKKIKGDNRIPNSNLTYNIVAMRNWGFDKSK